MKEAANLHDWCSSYTKQAKVVNSVRIPEIPMLLTKLHAGKCQTGDHHFGFQDIFEMRCYVSCGLQTILIYSNTKIVEVIFDINTKQ